MESQYLSVKSVARRYDISEPTVWRRARLGTMPKPVHLSAGCTRWRVSDLVRWERSQIGEREAS